MVDYPKAIEVYDKDVGIYIEQTEYINILFSYKIV